MLEAVGLRPREESLYLDLVNNGSATVADLAHRTGVPPASVRRTVTGLDRKGLVHRTPPPQELVVAVPPDLAVERLVRGKQDELERVRQAGHMLAARTRTRHGNRRTAELIEIVEGREGVRQAFERLQRNARQEVRVLVAPPYAATSWVNTTQLDEDMSGVAYRAVYTTDALQEPGFLTALAANTAAGEQARIASVVPIKLAIADDTLALLPLDWSSTAQDAAVLVHPCGLLEALAALFESVWNLATPVGADQVDFPEEITAEDRALISLLVAGLTDEAAGARLAMSRRTVVRRVQRLMETTGSRSRLQLGWRVRDRRWP